MGLVMHGVARLAFFSQQKGCSAETIFDPYADANRGRGLYHSNRGGAQFSPYMHASVRVFYNVWVVANRFSPKTIKPLTILTQCFHMLTLMTNIENWACQVKEKEMVRWNQHLNNTTDWNHYVYISSSCDIYIQQQQTCRQPHPGSQLTPGCQKPLEEWAWK